MRRQTMAAVLAFALLTLPSASFAAEWQLGVQGGASLPTGDTDAKTGYLLGGFADYVFNPTWTFGANFSTTRNNHKDIGVTEDFGGGSTYTLNEDKFTTMQFGVHTKYMIPASGPIKPYGVLGLGMTSFKEEYTETYVNPGVPVDKQSYELKEDAKVGGKLGAGALWWLNEMWGLGGEVDYNYVSEDGGSLTYIGLRALAVVKIPTGK